MKSVASITKGFTKMVKELDSLVTKCNRDVDKCAVKITELEVKQYCLNDEVRKARSIKTKLESFLG